MYLALMLSGKDFVRFARNIQEFAKYFERLTNIQEAYSVSVKAAELEPKRPAEWRNGLVERGIQAKTYSLSEEEPLKNLPGLPAGWTWHLSTPEVPGISVGTTPKRMTNTKNKRISTSIQVHCFT